MSDGDKILVAPDGSIRFVVHADGSVELQQPGAGGWSQVSSVGAGGDPQANLEQLAAMHGIGLLGLTVEEE